MTVLRRLDAVLEGTKRDGQRDKERLDNLGIVDQDLSLRAVAGRLFYNASKFTMRDLRARASRQQLEGSCLNRLDRFSPDMQDILGTLSSATRSRGCCEGMHWGRD